MHTIGQETPSSTEPHNLLPYTVDLVQSDAGEGKLLLPDTAGY